MFPFNCFYMECLQILFLCLHWHLRACLNFANLDVCGHSYYFITNKYKVKVKVVDENGKSIYKKTLKNAFLYVFSNGQIQVGKPNFNQILITESELTDDNIGIIREKEGVY